jgi:hypothetical protein
MTLRKIRKYRNAEQARKERDAAREWNAILAKHSETPFGTSDRGLQPRTSRIPSYSDLGVLRQRNERRSDVTIVERTHTASVTGPSVEAPRYEGDMLEREIKAQEEIAKKIKRIAPLYNKGAAQYITDETDPKTIGRK